MPRFVYNARTGELSGVTSIKVGDPQVSIEEYVTNYISSGQQASVYDSDLVTATLAKNFNTSGAGFDSDQVVAIINENVAGAGGIDSDTIMNMAAEHGWALDSDGVLAAVIKNLNIANVATTTNINDLDSDILVLQFSIAGHANRLDSDSTQIQANKTRLYTVVKDNDSDHNKSIQSLNNEISRVDNQLDSDHNKFAGFRRFVLSTTGTPTSDMTHYYSAAGGFGYNPFHDSDLVIASAIKGFNVAAASYDSDRVVQTITTAGEIALKDYFLDSEEVFNMGSEHGWNFDSDKIMESVTKNINSTITISGALNNLLDSEEATRMFAEHELATKSDIDSEIALIKTALDSETARIQLLLSNADSDQIAIAELRVSADSDTTVIQSLRSQAELDQAQITLIRNDLDSDTTAIQALNTRVDSDYARTNTRFGSIEGDVNTLQAQTTVSISRLNALEANEDSDYAQLKAEIAGISSSAGFDSDQVVAIINENVAAVTGIADSDLKAVADLRNDVDSDSIRIQDHSTRIGVLEAAVDGTGFDSDQVVAIINENVATVTGIADSDLKAVADLRNDLDSDFSAFDSRITINYNDIQNLNTITNSQGGRITLLENRRDSESAKVQTINGTVATLQSTQNAYGGRITTLENRSDSDETAIQDISTRVTALEGAVDDTGFDSDQIESMINEHVTAYDDSGIVARLDSDSTIIQNLQTQISGLVDDTGFDSDQIESMINEHVTPYDDSGIVARLDSDTTAISARLPLAGGTMSGDIDGNGNKVLFANVYSNEVDLPNASTYHGMFAHVHATGAGYFAHGGNWIRLSNHSDAALKTDLDSETARIQLLLLSTDSDALSIAGLVQEADSDAAAIAELLRQADSDAIAIQAFKTDLTTDINILKSRADSDEIVIQSLGSSVNILIAGLDSDSTKIQLMQGEIDSLRSDADSDSVKIQLMQGSITALESGTYNDAPLIARLDSDTTAISALRTELDGLSGTAAINTTVYTYTATQGQTTFTGADSNGLTLSYAVGKIYVFLNGILILDTTDYTATNGSSIVLQQAADSDNTLQVIKHVGTVQAGFDSDQVVAIISENQSASYNDAALVARLDSDTTAISALRTELDLIGQTEISIDTTGQSQTALDSFPTTVRSAEYLISASSNDSSWFASKVIVIHDGTDAYHSEYGVVSTHDSEFITFAVDINSGNVRLLGTPSNSAMNVKMKRTIISQS